ncbi:transposase [Clostridium grantii]|uniref:transposase n=1 Tax=Clostridium grantii TaxID=40575 RepID=UPI001160B187|nr:transposase [Clostridium grantii]
MLSMVLLTGKFNNVGFSSGTKSDSDCMHDVIYDVEAKDLCIKDLGYYNLRIFEKLNEKGAFYLSSSLSISLFLLFSF